MSKAQGLCSDFGINGIASSLASQATTLKALTTLSNGKIVAVGYYDDGEDKDFLVVRYNSDGKPDQAFGYNGIRTFDLGDHRDDEALCVAVASDGNILVGGVVNGYGAIIKINSSGRLVTSFGSGGKIVYDVLYSSVEELLVGSSGTIYGVGKTFHTANIVIRQLKVQAYNASGVLIPSFAEGGKYIDDDFLVWHTTEVNAALQADGKLVVGGTTLGPSDSFEYWTLLRLNTGGTVDTEFGDNGYVFDPENATTRLRDIAIGADGSILLGGFSNESEDQPPFAVAKRFKPNGDPDTSFNMTGSATHLLAGNGARIYAVGLRPDGGLSFVGARGEMDDTRELILAAFLENGEYDAAFGLHAGFVAGTSHGELHDMIRLSDGSFITCGYVYGADQTYGILRKYKADGSVDTGFNSSGASFIRYERSGSTRAVAIQGDGKVLAGGTYVVDGSSTGLDLARFLPDGSPDLTFGTYGYSRVNITENREFVKDIVVLSDGKILVGGSVNNPTSGDDYLVVRLNANGTVDESFGNGGFITRHVGAYAKHNDLNRIAVDNQGRILIAGDGNYLGGSYRDATIMRLLPDGSMDTSFGENGIYKISLSVVNDTFSDIQVAADGSLFVLGSDTGHFGAAVLKLTANGALDTSFGEGGMARIYWSDEDNTTASQLILLPDGNLIAGCSRQTKNTSFNHHAYLQAFLSSGEVNTAFGDQGIVEMPLSVSKDELLEGLIWHEGTFYLSGTSHDTKNYTFVIKLNADGSTQGTPFISYDFSTVTNAAINPSTKSVYFGVTEFDIFGLRVVCVGIGGEPEPEEEGCDAVPAPVITHTGNVLIASHGEGFEWYKDGHVLSGEDQPTLEIDPVAGGEFEVVALVSGCWKVSDPYHYVLTGISSEGPEDFVAYPNPFRDAVTIESPHDWEGANMSLISSTGMVLKELSPMEGGRSKLTLDNLSIGMYFLKIQSGRRIQIIKVFKTK